MSDLEALLAVQDRDTELDQLRHRRETLPERAALAGVDTRSAKVGSRIRELEAARGDLAHRQREIEGEVDHIDERLADLDHRLHSGDVTATRDLTAMLEQVDHLRDRKRSLEDEDLEVMEAIEPYDRELAELAGERERLDAEGGDTLAALREAEVAIDAELDRVVAARAEAVAAVPAELAAAYERTRQRLGGIGAARLVGNSCGGCHLVLSATEVDRIRRLPPDAMVTCEQCGRILVR